MITSVRRRRSWARVPLALALAFAALLAPGVTTAAHATSQVGVLVVDRPGSMNILGNATIEVFTSDPSLGAVTPVYTATRGWWSLVDFDEGTYWIRVRLAGYVEQTVRRTFHEGRQAIEIVLSRDPNYIGQLVGFVRDQHGDTVSAGRGRVAFVDATGQTTAVASTNQIGMYAATLTPGQYRVRATDSHGLLAGAWLGGTSAATARVFDVQQGVSTPLPDVTLLPGLALSGTVRDPAGRPVAYAEVSLHRADEPWNVLEVVTAAKNGTYALANVEPGPYKLQFTDPQGEFLAQWYQDATAFDDARTVQVGADTVLDDVTLMPAPIPDEPFALTGTVEDASGAPVRGVSVYAARRADDSTSWETVAQALTTSAGRYTFGGLPAGTYTVRVTPTEGRDGFDELWYGGTPRPSAARAVEVTEAGGVSFDPVTIVHHGALSGTVSLPAALADRDAQRHVEVFDEDGRLASDAAVDGAGDYTVTGLRPGLYTVRASGQYDAEDGVAVPLVSQFWRNAYSFGTATLVRVESEADETGIDLGLSVTLANVARPTVSGTAAYGTRLTASAGTWNRQARTAFAYQWTRNGAPVAGATKATYTTTAADLGRSVAVRVTASDRDDLLGSGSATSVAKVVKGRANVSMKVSGGTRSARVQIGLALQGFTATQQTGTVRVYDGTTLKKTVTVRKGTAAVSVTGLRKGAHTLTVKFAGSGSHTAASASTKVKVR